jgi:hypothetical protein
MNELEPIRNRTGRGKRTVRNVALLVSYQRHCFDRSIARWGGRSDLQLMDRFRKIHGSLLRQSERHDEIVPPWIL